MKTYSTLRNFYKGNATRNAIYYGNPSRKRIKKWLVILSIPACLLVGIAPFFESMLMSILFYSLGFSWPVLMIVYALLYPADYSKEYPFVKDYEGDKVYFIQLWKVMNHLGADLWNEAFMENLLKNAKERMGTEKGRSHLKELGAGGIFLVFLTVYLNKAFATWTDLSLAELSNNALLFFFGLIVMPAFLFYMLTDFYFDYVNRGFRLNKELYHILCDIETITKQEDKEIYALLTYPPFK